MIKNKFKKKGYYEDGENLDCLICDSNCLTC